MPSLRLGLPAMRPPDEDFDRDPSDRRVIGWVGAAIIALGVLWIVVRALG